MVVLISPFTGMGEVGWLYTTTASAGSDFETSAATASSVISDVSAVPEAIADPEQQNADFDLIRNMWANCGERGGKVWALIAWLEVA